MARPENDGSVRFLYGTALGRGLLKTIQVLHMDRLAVWFLRSGLSRPYMARFAKKNQIPISKEELKAFPTYRDFFLRGRTPLPLDGEPSHLISPSDGWLSVYTVSKDSAFAIKGSRYRIRDLLGDEASFSGSAPRTITTTATSTTDARALTTTSRACSTASSPSPVNISPSSP